MIQLLKKLLGMNSGADLKQLAAAGAMIIDVRTKEEYRTGHINGSANIPLQVLTPASVAHLAKDRPIITCCASGMRSASAQSMLRSQGFSNVYNGGGWHSLQRQLN